MPEVKRDSQPNVIIALSEAEAGKLRAILFNEVDFGSEYWANELYDTLGSLGIEEVAYTPEDPNEWIDIPIEEEEAPEQLPLPFLPPL